MAIIIRIINKINRIIFKRPSKEKVASLDYSDFSLEEWEIYNKVKNYTLTSPERIIALLRAVKYITENKIEGDIVECGVWKGGSMMAVAEQLLSLCSTNRLLYLYDTFEGMNDPSPLDVAVNGVVAKDYLDNLKRTDENKKDIVWAYSSLNIVKENLDKTNYPENRMVFVEGAVEKTIPQTVPLKIALLRLDTDWYASTKHELVHLFPLLSPQGVLIIDDYGHWQGCKKAVDEYFSEYKIKIFLNRIDYTGRLAIKQ